MTAGTERATVHYSGRVQHVGFRWRTRHEAGAHRVTGYVRNCADGRVELVVEGVRSDVDGFLAALGTRMSAYIADCVVTWSPGTGEYPVFEIRR